MSVPELYIAGTRTYAAEIAGYAEESGFRVVGLLEPFEEERVGQTIHGFPVTWLEDTDPTGAPVIVGTGEDDRHPVVDRLTAAGWQPATLVHQRAHVPPTTTIGAGSIVAPGVVIGACSTIGDYVLVGRGSLVGHHTRIGSFSTLGPGANVAGNVEVGTDVFIGMAAVVRDHVTIGSASFVAMGAVVIGDVAPGAEVKGFPARKRPAAGR